MQELSTTREKLTAAREDTEKSVGDVQRLREDLEKEKQTLRSSVEDKDKQLTTLKVKGKKGNVL